MLKIQKLSYFFGVSIFHFIERLLIWFISITPPKKVEEKSDKKKLLIIQFNAIGDFVIFTGVLPYFRELYPSLDWEITILASQEYTDIAKFLKMGVISDIPSYDNLITFNRLDFLRNLRYRYKFQRKIQKRLFDIVLFPNYSRNKRMDQLVRIINAPSKIAFEGKCEFKTAKVLAAKQKRDREIYTHLIKNIDVFQAETQKNVNFIRTIGFKEETDGVPRWQVPKKLVDSLLESKGLNEDYIVICPGAFASHRLWPANKLAEVIDYLREKYKIAILICGSPSDKSLSQEIQKHLKNKDKDKEIRCLCGQTNLIELAALISSAKLSLTMDSGPAHISIAVNTPLVCVVGGGHYKRFFPYGDPRRFRAATKELDCFYCDWNCKFDKPFCVSDISVETVIKEVDFLLKNENYSTITSVI
jgi:ADP-heptose:LPS heptosyltransferase